MAQMIVTEREVLEAALAESKAALAEAVINAAKTGVDPDEAAATLDKARACCRQLRAALVELERLEYNVCSNQWIDTEVKQSGAFPKRAVAAIPGEISKGAVTANPSSAQQPRPADVCTQQPLLRQTIGLLGLTLAYLQYFYVDVNLQIMSLPSALG